MTAPTSPDELAATLAVRCAFPPPGSVLPCAFSGGADSTALLVLARHAGCQPVAHHVDHRLRPDSAAEASRARQIAQHLDVPFELHTVTVDDGPNLEARAREARSGVLPMGCATGHTLDDQAETLLINLMRGAGPDGLGGIMPSPTKPLLRLRRRETLALCGALGIVPITDPSNADPRFLRNRVRAELLPLLDDLAQRDTAPLLARAAALCREDSEFLDTLADELDPTDARALAAAPPALGRRALRRWLTVRGYPPDAAGLDRVMTVVTGERAACELAGGVRVWRSGQRLYRSDMPDGGAR